MPSHVESGDQLTFQRSVKELDTKPLGNSEKSVPTAALATLLMPRRSRTQRKRPFFPSGDHGATAIELQAFDGGTSSVDVSIPLLKVPSFSLAGSSADAQSPK